DANLMSLASCRIVNLSMEHGNTDASCLGYVCLGLLAGPRFGDYQTAFRFGRLGNDLVERHGLTRFGARTALLFADCIIPWTRHLRTATELTRRAFDVAHAVGELRWATYSCDDLIRILLAVGDPLPDVQREAEHGLEFARKAGVGLVIETTETQLA